MLWFQGEAEKRNPGRPQTTGVVRKPDQGAPTSVDLQTVPLIGFRCPVPPPGRDGECRACRSAGAPVPGADVRSAVLDLPVVLPGSGLLLGGVPGSIAVRAEATSQSSLSEQ